MKIVLIGADGQLGTDIFNLFKLKGLDILGLTIDDINICYKDLCQNLLLKIKPSLVINTAAYNLVDACEDNVKLAFEVNAEGVKNVAEVCKSINAELMHFSTDYVFGGYQKENGKPFTEDDCPAPLSVYGISKLAGEYIIKYLLNKYYLIRVSGLYGHKSSLGKGYNFVDFIVNCVQKNQSEVKVVDDQVLTPTNTKDVAEKLFELIHTRKYGLYHMTNTGFCSWYEFANEIVKIIGAHIKIKPIKTKDFNAKAIRPSYSVLDNKKLREIGLKDLRHWKDALKEHLNERNIKKKS